MKDDQQEQLADFSIHMFTARIRAGLSQHQLGNAVGLRQSDISQMESGKRLPSLPQCIRLARVLRVSLQWFITGSNRLPTDLRSLSVQLHELGIGDLHVERESVPSAFRPAEEVIALVLIGNAPEARIVEALPAVLAWNTWNVPLLQVYARIYDPRVVQRIAWLSDIAMTIHQSQGFPGGCPAFSQLTAYQQGISPPDDEDSLGGARDLDERPPISRRWKIGYPAGLATFRERAEKLQKLRSMRLFRSPDAKE